MSVSKKRTSGHNLRAALIGFGVGGANFHAPIIDSTPGWELAAIVTNNEERKRKARADYPLTKIYGSAEDIWQHAEDFDVAIIATPNNTHVSFAETAMRAGLSVVLDKPMAPRFSDCESLIRVSASTGSLLTIFHNRRWDGDFLTLRQLIDNNTLGTVFRLESHFDRWRPLVKTESWREQGNGENGGGLLFDLGSHLIDQSIVLFGEPKSVYAELHRRRNGAAVDDDSFIALTFENDVCAHLRTTNLAAIRPPRFRLFGNSGTYEKFEMDPQEEALKSGHRPKSTAHWGEEEKHCWGRFSCEREGALVDGAVRTVPGDYLEFYRQLRAAILAGAPLPVAPQEGALVIRVIEAAYQSAQKGEVVKIQPMVPVG